MTETGLLLYLYGVVRRDAPDPPGTLAGIDGGGVRLLRADGVAAITSAVSATEYAEDALEERLRDVEWVGLRGVAHERVLTWFADRGPVVPLSLFSLHGDEARLIARVRERAESLLAALQRVEGCREWGVRLWRVERDFAETSLRDSPAVAEIADQIGSAPPGRRYLLEKKLASARESEARRISQAAAQQAYDELAIHSRDAAASEIPAGAARAERTLLLNAAFLVEDQRFPMFQDALSAVTARYENRGYEWEFTGPWPPYHFAAF